jgi:YggT family protein
VFGEAACQALHAPRNPNFLLSLNLPPWARNCTVCTASLAEVEGKGTFMGVNPIIWLIITVIDIYVWFVIASVVLSWLVTFDVINLRNRFVYMIYDMLYRITDPALQRIRRFTPRMQIDLSPIVLIVGLYFVRYSVIWLYVRAIS